MVLSRLSEVEGVFELGESQCRYLALSERFDLD